MWKLYSPNLLPSSVKGTLVSEFVRTLLALILIVYPLVFFVDCTSFVWEDTKEG